ncbi:TPA: hypothetical protein MIO10_26230 [Klebsiella pneumoniae]|nr:hypothetical protein [Salmonella enterica subsp. enterica serovar Havana]HBY0200075.1 hypothetical protein [Klebsiella pneumoniae]HBY0274569.1 hypothetical protein [Klebsiella pneumoniae]
MHLAAWLCSRVKFICHERGGVSGGLLPVLPDCRPVCGEPVRSGADKRCYGKYCTIKNAIPAMLKSIANGFMSKIPIDVENNPRTIILPTSPPTMRDKTV